VISPALYEKHDDRDVANPEHGAGRSRKTPDSAATPKDGNARTAADFIV
jgi:hypothetical protein